MTSPESGSREPEYTIEARRLPSGYWHIRGNGPCEWAQPPSWPCDEATLRAHAFPEASEKFIRAALRSPADTGEHQEGDVGS